MINPIIITKDNQGQRLDKFLNEQLTEFSRSQIQKMIESGEILVNGKKVSKHYFIKENDIIKRKTQNAKSKTTAQNSKLPITSYQLPVTPEIKVINETNDFLIIDKPAGLLVHPTTKNETDTLVDWLLNHYPQIKNVGEDPKRPGIVHRLDKEVSGLMLIPLNQKSFDYFKEQFKSRLIDKKYLALVYGEISQDTAKIDFVIGRSKAKAGVFAARPSQKDSEDKTAITEFEVKERFKNYTLLEVKILTGRTHQIRVHLKAYGHPIVGDQLYFNKKLIRQPANKKPLGRIFLHAHYLAFNDLKGQPQEFSNPLPEKLTAFLKSLKK